MIGESGAPENCTISEEPARIRDSVKNDGYTVVVELLSNERNALVFKYMWGMEIKDYEGQYKKNSALAAGRIGDTARFPNYSVAQSSSADSILPSSEKCNLIMIYCLVVSELHES